MPHPLLYEINTRCWLRELGKRRGAAITLANVPPEEFRFWQRCGFTHIWLMGVWTTGARARQEALDNADLRRAYQAVLPGWQKEDVAGSPYAVADYQVPAALGGEEGLKKFRDELNQRGIKLVLDFVPNHVGVDHPWTLQHPEYFVQSTGPAPDVFSVQAARGKRWLAHGKDPYFPGWTDTVQVDYRQPAARKAMLKLLQEVAARCDGVRCDMAMLLLNDVFAKTWAHLPPTGSPGRVPEFWAEAIPAVKQAQPGFIFLAEVYWGLDGHMQTLGFDYTYDKHLYDKLMARASAEAQQHLVATTPKYLVASAHFLENHDEERVAARLSPPEHRAAALLILALPGLRFLHEGQMTGYRLRIPVQLSRRPELPADPALVAYYDRLLGWLGETAVGRGGARVLAPRRAWADNPTAEDFVIVQWQARVREFELVVVNLAAHRSQCYVSLQIEGLAGRNWRMNDLLGNESYQRYGEDMAQGFYLDVPAHAAQLFRVQAI